MDIELTEELAEAVRDWRERWGLTHDEIRELGGPSSPTMTKIENADGIISIATARKLEKALGWYEGTVRELTDDEPAIIDTSRWHPPKHVPTGRISHDVVNDLAEKTRNDDDPDRAIRFVSELLQYARSANDESYRSLFLITAVLTLSEVIERDGTAPAGFVWALKNARNVWASSAHASELSVVEPAAGSGAFIRKAVLSLNDAAIIELAGVAAREGLIQLPPHAADQAAAGEEAQTFDDDHIP